MASLGFFRTSIHSMTDVARDKPYLQSVSARPRIRGLAATRKLHAFLPFRCLDLPSEDVLCVVIPKVDFRGAADGNTLGLAIVCLEKIRH